ncbi:unnamed protein product [Calypogeia fissa]
MVGDAGGFINPFAKPKRMIQTILSLLSKPGDTVMDFFSGGQVLRVALMQKRECFVYSDTDKEFLFSEAYAAVLCERVPLVKRNFFEFSSDPNEKLQEVEHGPAESAKDIPDNPVGSDRNSTKEGTVEDAPTQGDQEVADGAPKSPEQERGVYTKDPNERANDGKTMDTGYDDCGLDNLIEKVLGKDPDPKDAAGADAANADPNAANVDPNTTAAETVKESAGESMDHQAGASTFSSSPLFCASNEKLVWAGPSGSPLILRRTQNPRRSLGKTGYTYMKAHATHYVYRYGDMKGTKVTLEDAPRIIQNPGIRMGP